MSEFVALDEGHENGPALPQCLPARLAVGRAGEEPTQLGDPTQKGSVALEAFSRSLKLGREDLEGRRRRVRRGGAVASSGIAQRQKADGDDGERPEQWYQPIRLREPALLGPAPRFPGFVKLLHDPPPGVPRDNLERLIEALNRTRRQQQPREPVVPDPHTPDPDRCAPPGTVAGRQKLKLAPGHAGHRLASLGPDSRRAHGAGGPQRCERTATLNQATLPSGPHDRVPAGIPHTLEMREDVGAAVPDRDKGGAVGRVADRLDRFGPDRRLAGLGCDALGRPLRGGPARGCRQPRSRRNVWPRDRAWTTGHARPTRPPSVGRYSRRTAHPRPGRATPPARLQSRRWRCP